MKLLFRILVLCVSVAWSGVAHSQDGTVFSLVRDASELKEGDVVVIVNKAAEVALSTEASSGSSIAPVTVKIDDNDGVTVNAKVQFFYLKGSSSILHGDSIAIMDILQQHQMRLYFYKRNKQTKLKQK